MRLTTVRATLILAVITITLSAIHGSFAAGSVYDRALQVYRNGEFTEAIRLLKMQPSLNAGDYNLLGWAYLRSGNTDEAISQFNQSVLLAPSSFDSYCGLGFSYLRKGNLQESLGNFERGIGGNSRDIDCLLGKAAVLERLDNVEMASDVYRKVLTIDINNEIAKGKVAIATNMAVNKAKEDIKFFARGDYFWIRLKDETRPFFIKGVNLGFGTPGRYPTEFPEDINAYLEWFRLIKEMNANVIRTYTILPPQFYKALRQFNDGRRGEDNLFLMQGIWVELPESDNFRDAVFMDEVMKEINHAIDAVHGNVSIPNRYGHAHGKYTDDISNYVAGFIFGREWEPYTVLAYNKKGAGSDFEGEFLGIPNSTPMDAWLTEMLDHIISYETGQYKTSRPVAYMNWPPLDPVFHESEATLREETGFRVKTGEQVGSLDYSHAFDEDAVSLDENRIRVSWKYKSGIFASYHVYPYYPDFLRNDEKYGMDSNVKGAGYYYNYLMDLKSRYKGIPLLISEFGVPTSRGIARYQPDGMHHGGHNEHEQALIMQRMFNAIREAGAAGGIAFEWADEWFKSNWMVKGMEEDSRLWYNAQDPEESYGLIAMSPVGWTKMTDRGNAWDKATMLYRDERKDPLNALNDGYDSARNIRRVYADHDAGYLYIRIDTDGEPDWNKVAYLIAIDTVGDMEGDHLLPFNTGVESEIGFEFLVLLHGKNSSILIDNNYNRMEFDKSLLRFPGLSGYRENMGFKPVSNRDGIFTEEITLHRRRFSRSGKVFPERVYNASLLRQGNADEDSLSDFYYNRKGKFIALRIPWNLLYYVNPAARKIIYSKDEYKVTNGIRLLALSYKPVDAGNTAASGLKGGSKITDMVPSSMSDMKGFTWQGWDSPEYVVRPKRAYYALKESYGKVADPAIKVWSPKGFEFTPVVKKHYESPEKFLDLYRTDQDTDSDPYGLALANLVRGLVDNNPLYILEASSHFAQSSSMVHRGTGMGSGSVADDQVREASRLGVAYTKHILSGKYETEGNNNDKFERISIKKYPAKKREFDKIIIGRSSIKVKMGAVIATQTDRVTRDWLSAINYRSAPWDFKSVDAVTWHEGQKILELVNYAQPKIHPVWGTRVRKFGDRWYAPDADGIFRFEISDDKVYSYPTNIIIDEKTVIINDTHGISAIAWDSLNADLAIGCGDYTGKVEAAYYLAQRGVDVYMPTDRFLNTLIGTRTDGIIIGSAPVKKTADGAIIGDQPIVIDVHEKIVVSNSHGGYPVQYYDTPYRYFKELGKYTGKEMDVIPVDIEEYGKAAKVVDEARRTGARLIGVRVAVRDEHDAVYKWLSEDKGNRAVLFHSSVYPEGYKLFFEFPGQTTFGDINVYFE